MACFLPFWWSTQWLSEFFCIEFKFYNLVWYPRVFESVTGLTAAWTFPVFVEKPKPEVNTELLLKLCKYYEATAPDIRKRPLPLLGITNWSCPLFLSSRKRPLVVLYIHIVLFVIIWIREVFNLCGCMTCTFAFVHFVSGQPLLLQHVVIYDIPFWWAHYRCPDGHILTA